MAIPTGTPISTAANRAITIRVRLAAVLPERRIHKALRPGDGDKLLQHPPGGGRNSGLISCNAATAHQTASSTAVVATLRVSSRESGQRHFSVD